MMRQLVTLVALGLMLATTAPCQEIPAGTVLPIMMSNSVDSSKSKPGDRVSGRLMQDVVLPSGVVLRARSTIEGQVVRATEPAAPIGASLEVRFTYLISGGKKFPINVSLRALASMLDVFDAQLPVNSFDEYGTSTSDWTTVQVGGAAVYRGDGTVRSAMDVVGRATDYGAVTAKLTPAPKRGCPANSTETEDEQSLWVFSPWACGTYGFEDLKIAHHGATPPVGVIEFESPRRVRVLSGSGWLLRVVPSGSGSQGAD